MNRRAVFLDRDGVINRAVVREGKPYPPASLAELDILPGVLEALQQLRQAGFLLVVATNQPDVARGTTPRAMVEAIHQHLYKQLPLDDIRVCYHDNNEHCHCRKPKPGLLLDAARDWHIDLQQSFMIGDRWRDIDAGQQAGCQTLFIDYGYTEKQPERCDYRVASLLDATRIILETPVSRTDA
ncbi:MAG: HAD family hydrolase [Gammaproteobacteria bacterium]|nr:HAD family hydrolase [Gammaproteobacteria bacterium]